MFIPELGMIEPRPCHEHFPKILRIGFSPLILPDGQFADISHAKIARRVTLSQAVALVPSGKSKL
jgi:hypothetical protein